MNLFSMVIELLVSSSHRVRRRSQTTEVLKPHFFFSLHHIVIPHTQRKIIKDTEAAALNMDIKDRKKGI